MQFQKTSGVDVAVSTYDFHPNGISPSDLNRGNNPWDPSDDGYHLEPYTSTLDQPGFLAPREYFRPGQEYTNPDDFNLHVRIEPGAYEVTLELLGEAGTPGTGDCRAYLALYDKTAAALVYEWNTTRVYTTNQVVHTQIRFLYSPTVTSLVAVAAGSGGAGNLSISCDYVRATFERLGS